jgi:NADH-quinone oxidoreductase subunit A
MDLEAYFPILVMFILATGFVAAAVLLARWVSTRGPNSPEQLAAYECGIVTEVEPSHRFSVKFYLTAMLFVIFDVEIIFLFAWAANFKEFGWYGTVSVGLFTFFVLVTLAYVWKRGALDWQVARRERQIVARLQDAA